MNAKRTLFPNTTLLKILKTPFCEKCRNDKNGCKKSCKLPFFCFIHELTDKDRELIDKINNILELFETKDFNDVAVVKLLFSMFKELYDNYSANTLNDNQKAIIDVVKQLELELALYFDLKVSRYEQLKELYNTYNSDIQNFKIIFVESDKDSKIVDNNNIEIVDNNVQK